MRFIKKSFPWNNGISYETWKPSKYVPWYKRIIWHNVIVAISCLFWIGFACFKVGSGISLYIISYCCFFMGVGYNRITK